MASAALLVFVVFLVGIAISIPIGTSMALGSLAPILLMGKGGSIAQVLNNTFSGANSTPLLAVPLLLGGIFPNILIGVLLMVYAVWYCKTKGEDRALIDAKMKELKGNGLRTLFKESFWALMCPIIVLGGIYAGFVTPTEAAVISVFYALFVSLFIYKSVKVKDLLPMLCSSVKTYGGLASVPAFATAYGLVLSLTKATKAVTDFIGSSFHSSFTVLTVLVIISLLLGMVMDTGPAIIILAPVLLPAVQELDVHDVHFGVILVCCLSIGLATPPFGLDLFVAGNLAEEPPMSVSKKATTISPRRWARPMRRKICTCWDSCRTRPSV